MISIRPELVYLEGEIEFVASVYSISIWPIDYFYYQTIDDRCRGQQLRKRNVNSSSLT